MNRSNFTTAIGVLVTVLISIGLAEDRETERKANDLQRILAGVRAPNVDATTRDRVTWVSKCFKDFQAIKVGMTREDVAKRFPMDGGLQGVSPVRFTHPECPYFKIDVEFSFQRNPQDQGRAIMSPEDKATKVSKPYIEPPYID